MTKTMSISSIKRCVEDVTELELPGDPKAVAHAQAQMSGLADEIDGTCLQPDFTCWQGRSIS